MNATLSRTSSAEGPSRWLDEVRAHRPTRSTRRDVQNPSLTLLLSSPYHGSHRNSRSRSRTAQHSTAPRSFIQAKDLDSQPYISENLVTRRLGRVIVMDCEAAKARTWSGHLKVDWGLPPFPRSLTSGQLALRNRFAILEGIFIPDFGGREDQFCLMISNPLMPP